MIYFLDIFHFPVDRLTIIQYMLHLTIKLILIRIDIIMCGHISRVSKSKYCLSKHSYWALLTSEYFSRRACIMYTCRLARYTSLTFITYVSCDGREKRTSRIYFAVWLLWLYYTRCPPPDSSLRPLIPKNVRIRKYVIGHSGEIICRRCNVRTIIYRPHTIYTRSVRTPKMTAHTRCIGYRQTFIFHCRCHWKIIFPPRDVSTGAVVRLTRIARRSFTACRRTHVRSSSVRKTAFGSCP